MSIKSNLAVGFLVIVFVVIFSSQISTWWEDLVSKNLASQQAKNLAPKISVGQTVCNLKITVSTQLTSDLFSPNPDNLFIVTTHYNWFGCKTVVNSASLIQMPPPYFEKLTNGYGNVPPQYDFALLNPVNIPLRLVLSSPNGQEYNSNLLPDLTQNIHVPAGFVKEPYGSTITYLLTLIPRADYKASVSSDQVKIRFTTSEFLPAGSSVYWEISGAKDSG